MDKTVEVTIPVEPERAVALSDARNREAVGRLVSRILCLASGPTPSGASAAPPIDISNLPREGRGPFPPWVPAFAGMGFITMSALRTDPFSGDCRVRSG